MRAVIVCVNYSDYLQITLPYNRHHFEDICVITSFDDRETHEVTKQMNSICLVRTNKFYENNAHFNKWSALEQGLDIFGRFGWLCIMDADILWPKEIKGLKLEKGKLYSPWRRMYENVRNGIPPESEWNNYKKFPDKFAGYSQIFHAEDPVLGPAPWHEINWKHAGGADTYFQNKWSMKNKIRPPFEVLHLGTPGTNWCGRSTPYLNGEIPPDAQIKKDALDAFMQGRRVHANYKHERF
jgi:hypothetical protein